MNFTLLGVAVGRCKPSPVVVWRPLCASFNSWCSCCRPDRPALQPGGKESRELVLLNHFLPLCQVTAKSIFSQSWFFHQKNRIRKIKWKSTDFRSPFGLGLLFTYFIKCGLHVVAWAYPSARTAEARVGDPWVWDQSGYVDRLMAQPQAQGLVHSSVLSMTWICNFTQE